MAGLSFKVAEDVFEVGLVKDLFVLCVLGEAFACSVAVSGGDGDAMVRGGHQSGIRITSTVGRHRHLVPAGEDVEPVQSSTPTQNVGVLDY